MSTPYALGGGQRPGKTLLRRRMHPDKPRALAKTVISLTKL
jgi:hypothetical protein